MRRRRPSAAAAAACAPFKVVVTVVAITWTVISSVRSSTASVACPEASAKQWQSLRLLLRIVAGSKEESIWFFSRLRRLRLGCLTLATFWAATDACLDDIQLLSHEPELSLELAP